MCAMNIDIAVLLHFCSPKDRQVLKNASASGGLRPSDPIPRLRPWTPPGDNFGPQTQNSSPAPERGCEIRRVFCQFSLAEWGTKCT